MDKQSKRAPHCLILPYPMQGHINPMLQFSKSLQENGIKVTLITTNFMFKTLHKLSSTANSISIETISDGFDEGGRAEAETPKAYLTKLQQVGSQTLAELLENLANSRGLYVDCIVYDSLLPWVLGVAKKFELLGAVFFTQSCAVDNIFYNLYKKILNVPLLGPQVFVPGLPPLEPLELPSYVYDHESHPAIFKMLVDQFVNIDQVDWVLCNTFYTLEEEVISWMSKFLDMKTIGPTVPLKYLKDDGMKLTEGDSDYAIHLYEPNVVASLNWLNNRQPESVVYVSFGSVEKLNVEQMEELAWGLRQSNKYFLWVVRESEMSKLPKEYLKETSEKGLVIPWCSQLDVLAHKSTCCFLTHCGWNSVLEAISLGVPMLAMPQHSDQSTNAKYVVDFWKIGVKIKGDDNGKVNREMVEKCVNEVMDGEKGKEIKMNARKWKEMAREAVNEGGSSDKNIYEFVTMLVQHSQ